MFNCGIHGKQKLDWCDECQVLLRCDHSSTHWHPSGDIFYNAESGVYNYDPIMGPEVNADNLIELASEEIIRLNNRVKELEKENGNLLQNLTDIDKYG